MRFVVLNLAPCSFTGCYHIDFVNGIAAIRSTNAYFLTGWITEIWYLSPHLLMFPTLCLTKAFQESFGRVKRERYLWGVVINLTHRPTS
jgi:hypothetical protein